MPDMQDQKFEMVLEAQFRERISRLFIFRFLWAYIMIWPLIVWCIWMYIIMFLHFWYKLFLGKRHQGFWKKELRFFRHVTKWQGYFMCIVDKRPMFIED